MKPSNNRHIALLATIFMTAILLPGLFSSCSSLIDEDMADCRYGCGLRFEYLIYDDNGGSADAFPTSVDLVSAYVFDEQGRYVTTITESGEALSAPDWRMNLDLEPGKYKVIAWAGLDGVSFTESSLPYDSPQDLSVRLNRESSISDNDLHPLWHGAVDVEVAAADYSEYTVSLIKDTRRIRVILQQINGDPLRVRDFSFKITDDNSHLGYDNMPIPDGTTTYLPYALGQQTVGGDEYGMDATVVAYSEFATSRLVVGNKPRLVVNRSYNPDADPVIDIPLLDYLLLRKAEGSKITNQQFLDRTDSYTLIFFLDKDLYWIRTSIVINGWTIRLNSGDFE